MKKQASALVIDFRVVTTLNYYFAGEPSVLEEIAGGQAIEDYFCFMLNFISALEFRGFEDVYDCVNAEASQFVVYFKHSEKCMKDIRIVFALELSGHRQTKDDLLRRIDCLKQQTPNIDFQVNRDKSELCFPMIAFNNKSFNDYREAVREISIAVTKR